MVISLDKISLNYLKSNHMSTGKVILGILGAATAGVVIGMLCAPEKGSDLRRKIRSTTNDWADHVSDLISSGKSKAEDLAAQASGKVNKMKNDLS